MAEAAPMPPRDKLEANDERRELAASRTWRRPPFIASPWLRWAIYLGRIVYLVAALSAPST